VGTPYTGKRPRQRKVRCRKGGQRMNGATIYARGFADPGNVVTCPVVAGDSSHPARMPEHLARFFIALATDEGDVVLDPFMGSGTTARAARALGRKYLGFEIHPEYLVP
jgi:hypothetical protein